METIAAQIGVGDHFFPLIVMSQNEQPLSQPLPKGLNVMMYIGHADRLYQKRFGDCLSLCSKLKNGAETLPFRHRFLTRGNRFEL